MFDEVNKKQGKASNIDYSIWTSASAGSGKTYVLVNRLLRMFLAGVQPSKILCITYTNTGAVEMKNRINKKLAEWTILSEDKLKEEIVKLEEGNKEKLEEKVKIARTLFSKILDCSNDFKILTIHSFCQQIIKRFPLEANIIPNFQIADDILSSELLLKAKIQLLETSNQDLKTAIEDLFTYKNEDDVFKLLKYCIDRKDDFLYLLKRFFNVDGVITEIKNLLNIENNKSMDELVDDFIENIDLSFFTEALLEEIDATGESTNQKFAKNMKKFIKNKSLIKDSFDDFISIYLTDKFTIRKSILNQSITKKSPEIKDLLDLQSQEVYEFINKYHNYLNLNFTSSFLIIFYNLLDIYSKLKKEAGYLDYSDLILEATNLLNDNKYKNIDEENNYSSWVNYKLDEGIDHLLLDEAQDTSPLQWDIVKSITEEFFSGFGTKEDVKRSLFVVGDEKQSIFSFQGAEPKKFNEMMKYFKEKIELSQNNFENIRLDTSFRTLKTILNIADEVFKEPFRKNAISQQEEPILHNIIRQGGLGRVEIWPLIENKKEEEEEEEEENKKKEKSKAKEWVIDYKETIEENSKQKLARKLVEEIESWFINGRLILDKKTNEKRKIKYSDIMILIRNRSGNFIDYLIKEFNRKKIPIMGKDKFDLLNNIISKDIISLLKFTIFNEDDLSLANIVKSPFLNLTEEDLYNLCCYKNEKNISLWQALKENKNNYQAQVAFLEDIIKKTELLSLYSLIFYIFETKNYRKNFKERFPYYTDDIINEFIRISNDYEKTHNNTTILNFIYFIENTKIEIKQDLDNSSNDIKIITAHSSKGLEAPIVILPDVNHTTKNIYNQDDILIYREQGNDFITPILMKKETNETKKIKETKKLETEEEYLRLLYVAITRAENELYICDSRKFQDQKVENSWYKILLNTIKNLEHKTRKINDIEGDVLYVGDEYEFNKNLKEKIEEKDFTKLNEIAQEIEKETKKENEYTIINPSLFYSHNSIKNPQENSKNLEIGKLVHKLLEILPKNQEKEETMNVFLKNNPLKEEVKKIVLDILNNQKFSFLFNENSKAEVPIFGKSNKKNEIISGKIDRLAIVDDIVYIVDYKTSNYKQKEIPENYKKQLQSYKEVIEKIYIDKIVKCYILWTSFSEIEVVQ